MVGAEVLNRFTEPVNFGKVPVGARQAVEFLHELFKILLGIIFQQVVECNRAEKVIPKFFTRYQAVYEVQLVGVEVKLVTNLILTDLTGLPAAHIFFL